MSTGTVLLVLDHCEHLGGIGPYVARLLMACPGLTALVTSRVPLNIVGEHRFEVRPLALPLPVDVDRLPLKQVATIPAVALFLERAQAARPELSLTVDNAAAITAICRRLDGLPLALELVAPYLALLSPDELLARLGRQVWALGAAGGPDRAARQQTLCATLDWSYDLQDRTVDLKDRGIRKALETSQNGG
jgi:predicted ATPase